MKRVRFRGLCATLLLSIVAAAILLASRQVQPVPTPDRRVTRVVGPSTVDCTFTPERTGLFRIDLYLTPVQPPSKNLIVFHYRESPSASADRDRLTIDAGAIRLPGYYPCAFKPKKNLPGSPIRFYLDAPEAAGAPVLAVGTTHDGTELAFIPHYRGFVPPKSAGLGVAAGLRNLAVQVASGKPGLPGRAWSYTVLAAVYLALVGLLGWALGSMATHEPPGAGSPQDSPHTPAM
ncbi:MAG: hypothetical protein AB1714_16510 [Acidobacteriota bacterium]